MNSGYPKMKSNDVIKNGKNKFWDTKKLRQFNKTIFFLIEQTNNFNKPVEIIFENEILNASQITKIIGEVHFMDFS